MSIGFNNQPDLSLYNLHKRTGASTSSHNPLPQLLASLRIYIRITSSRNPLPQLLASLLTFRLKFAAIAASFRQLGAHSLANLNSFGFGDFTIRTSNADKLL